MYFKTKCFCVTNSMTMKANVLTQKVMFFFKLENIFLQFWCRSHFQFSYKKLSVKDDIFVEGKYCSALALLLLRCAVDPHKYFKQVEHCIPIDQLCNESREVVSKWDEGHLMVELLLLWSALPFFVCWRCTACQERKALPDPRSTNRMTVSK